MSKRDSRKKPDMPDLSGPLSEAGKYIANKVWEAVNTGKELAEARNDKAERLAIYERIGDFISKQFGIQPKLGFQTAVHLAGQGDAAAADVALAPREVVAKVKKSLLMVRLEYLAENNSYSRVLSFWYVRGDKPARQTMSEGLSWDALPREVREQWQRDRDTPVTFRLYSEEK